MLIRSTIFLVLFSCLTLFIGCGGNQNTAPTGSGILDLTLDWSSRSRVDLSAVESVRIEVFSGNSAAGTKLAQKIADRSASNASSTIRITGMPLRMLYIVMTAYPQIDGAGNPLGEMAQPVLLTSTVPVPIPVSFAASTITKVVITPTAPVVSVGKQLRLIATAYNSANTPVFVEAGRISWTSASLNVATINASTGLATGISAGTTRITATESVSGISTQTTLTVSGTSVTSRMVVFGYSELGMHCMSQDFSELMILPPYNSLHAQVVDRSGEDPRIVTSSITVNYSVPGNTYSVGKTNFWTFAPQLLGRTLPPNIGLTGNGLSGKMTATTNGDWAALGIPLTPITDAHIENPYQLSNITVTSGGVTVASTKAVASVSWEISCNLCHNTSGISTATDILRRHDRLHGTTLVNQKPVTCGKCHAQVPLGLTGVAGVPSLSRSMHSSHAARMSTVNLAVSCYACHPGIRTKCQRDIHYTKGMTCTSCHSSMTAVASATRRPWQDEPRCGTCHKVAEHTYEQAGTLFRNSKGHHSIHCTSCHGAPHAITPVDSSITNNDNLQAIALQGYAGTINKCTVCHRTKPDDSFEHHM